MNLRKDLLDLIFKHNRESGTNTQGSIRDILTDLKHICDSGEINFQERLEAALEVADLEDKDGLLK